MQSHEPDKVILLNESEWNWIEFSIREMIIKTTENNGRMNEFCASGERNEK